MNGDRSAFCFDLNTAELWCLEDSNTSQRQWKWQWCCVRGRLVSSRGIHGDLSGSVTPQAGGRGSFC